MRVNNILILLFITHFVCALEIGHSSEKAYSQVQPVYYINLNSKLLLFAANVIESLLINQCIGYLGLEKPASFATCSAYIQQNLVNSFPCICRLLGIAREEQAQVPWYKPTDPTAFGIFSALFLQNFAVLKYHQPHQSAKNQLRDAFLIGAAGYIAAYALYFCYALRAIR